MTINLDKSPAAPYAKENEAEQDPSNTGEQLVSLDNGDKSLADTNLPAPKRDALGRAYATGRRKESVARVWIQPGKGEFTVNGRQLATYFRRSVLQMIVRQPLVLLEADAGYKVMCTVKGGGLSGQAGAVRHGVARALNNYAPTYRAPLKQQGLLTRDSRSVERKKYGRRKARTRFQFSKR